LWTEMVRLGMLSLFGAFGVGGTEAGVDVGMGARWEVLAGQRLGKDWASTYLLRLHDGTLFAGASGGSTRHATSVKSSNG
jgi:hypothetical protein